MEEPQHSSIQQYIPSDEYRPEPETKPLLPVWLDGSMRIGIHTSIAGDVCSALDIAKALGANALQIFSSSPRMWSRGTLGSKAMEASSARFRARREELKLGPLVVHTNYLINLASRQPVLRVRSIQAFHDEIVRAVSLGADFLVMHPGCACGVEMNIAIAAIANGLKQAARGIKFGNLRILLENTAGQGTSVGSRFAELQAILDLCAELPMGVCVDTAHLFAAGHDLRRAEGLDRALIELSTTIGLERVFVIHVNDSKGALGSHLDRHEHIGKGKIGLEGFRRVLNHPQLAGRAFILETPIDRPGDDRRNVDTLWKLVGEKPRSLRGAVDGFAIRQHKKRAHTRPRISRKIRTRAKSAKRRG
ncbi:MAG TPA: deoxyribonuclease IV [Candidatus Acidoferrales bacterium]|nr:deoxyribonuclease IV [Candidatus Acidoferrales bacterium]